jgi:hypothetical protein
VYGQGVEQRKRCALREHGHGQRPDATTSSSVTQSSMYQRRTELTASLANRPARRNAGLPGRRRSSSEILPAR